MIKVKTKNHEKTIKMEDGKSISQYYNELIETAQEMGLVLDINTKPQEMATTVLFEDDTEHHHYNEQAAAEMLEWFQFAWDAELQFIAPFRQRKVYPGLFWGTFDVSCIILYNEFESFPDDSKVIERGAFDEHMIEFGFWLGDDNIEHPSFFTLPYPFVEGVELEIDDSFPAESYFSAKMAEYIYEIKGGIDNKQSDQAIKFMEASCSKSLEYLKWENVNHYFEDLKMEKNKKNS